MSTPTEQQIHDMFTELDDRLTNNLIYPLRLKRGIYYTGFVIPSARADLARAIIDDQGIPARVRINVADTDIARIDADTYGDHA